MDDLSLDPSFDPATLDREEVATYYRLLQLSPGATIEEVDRAYFRLKRQVPSDQLEPLKTAHKTVKGMLQYYFSHETGETESPPSHSVQSSHRDTPLFVQLAGEWLEAQGVPAEVNLNDRELRIHVSAQQYSTPDRVVPKIKTALQKLTDRERQDLTGIKVYGMQRRKHILWKREIPLERSATALAIPGLAAPGWGLNSAWSDIGWFTLVSWVAILCNHFPLTDFLFIGLKIWLHEWGHATIAWLSGYRAIPLPFGWTNVDDTHSFWVYLSVLALISLFGWSSWREQRRWGMGVAIGLMLIQFGLTWGISADTFGMLLAFGGIGGEFYLCALLMITFFFPLPHSFRWDVNRFPVVFSAALTFWDAFFLWNKIDRGQAFIPWGTLFGGEGDSAGDMDILVAYGWNYDRIIDTYNSIGDLCLLVITGVYGYAIFQAYNCNKA